MNRDQDIYLGLLDTRDEAQLLEFYRRFIKKGNRTVEVYQWRKQYQGGNLPYVAKQNGRIVGAVTAFPVSLIHNNQRINAAWQADSIVDPAMRGKGLGKKLVNLAAQNYDVVLAKGTSPPMYRLRKSVGFVDVGNSNILLRVLSPVVSQGNWWKRLGYAFLYFATIFHSKIEEASGFQVQEIRKFGSVFDRLATEWPQNDEINMYKDSRYLNWRYINCPFRSYRVLQVTDGMHVRGVLILRMNPKPREMGWIVDILYPSGNKEILRILLKIAIIEFRKSKASDARTFASSQNIRTHLFALGFKNLKDDPRFTYRVENRKLGIDYTSATWNFWHGDGDLELYD